MEATALSGFISSVIFTTLLFTTSSKRTRKTFTVKKTFLFTVLLGALTAKAQQSETLFDNQQLTVTATKVPCHDETNGIHQEKVLLTFLNKAATPVEVSFEMAVWYDNVLQRKGDVPTYKVALDAMQKLSGGCQSKDKALSIFSRHLDLKGRALTRFELQNITVKPTANK